MRVVDTSAWIEWLRDSPTGFRIMPLLPQRADWIVPTIVQLELTKWIKREFGDDRIERVIGFTKKCQVVNLSTELALAAADVSAIRRLSTADAIIYATAEAWDADLLTCDAHFKELPNTIFIPKLDS